MSPKVRSFWCCEMTHNFHVSFQKGQVRGKELKPPCAPGRASEQQAITVCL